MIDKIDIGINNGIFEELNAIILPREKKTTINNKEYNIDNEKINRILSILSTWEHEYKDENNKIIDAQEFNINVWEENKSTNYHGKGNFPSNYVEFIGIIGGIQNGE